MGILFREVVCLFKVLCTSQSRLQRWYCALLPCEWRWQPLAKNLMSFRLLFLFPTKYKDYFIFEYKTWLYFKWPIPMLDSVHPNAREGLPFIRRERLGNGSRNYTAILCCWLQVITFFIHLFAFFVQVHGLPWSSNRCYVRFIAVKTSQIGDQKTPFILTSLSFYKASLGIYQAEWKCRHMYACLRIVDTCYTLRTETKYFADKNVSYGKNALIFTSGPI
jgi:hypothetical protein